MAFPRSSLTKATLPGGPTYEYLYIAASSQFKPTLLFLHGFPSSSYDWRHQISHFSSLGYGILAPNLLGYGGTDKPADPAAYQGKKMAGEVVELLDFLGIERVVGVGHDWGSFLLSRLATFHSDRILKYVFVDIPYQPPSAALNRQMFNVINETVKKHAGYSPYGHYLFFDDEDAAELADAYPDSIQSLFHALDPEIKKYNLGQVGGARTWVSEGRVAEWPSYLSEEDINYNKELFSLKNGGYRGPTNWYKAQVDGLNSEDDKAVPQEDYILKHPTLFVSGEHYPLIMATDPVGRMKPFAPNLIVKPYSTGHWIQLEAPERFNQDLQEFLEV